MLKIRPAHFLKLAAGVALLALGGCASVPELSRLNDFGPGKTSVVVNLEAQKAYLYRGDRVVGISPVSTGREGHNTPMGKRAVIAKDIDHRSSVYGKYVKNGRTIKAGVDVRKDPKPPGATYVGASMPYYMQVAPGFGLHEGYLPGYPASHGCIRMPARWAKRFYYAVEIGTPVLIK